MNYNLFRPNEGILDKIKFKAETGYSSYHIFTPESIPAPFRIAIAGEILTHYRQDLNKRLAGTVMITTPIWEAVRNGICHGGSKAVLVGLFLGEKGAVYGIDDGGEYFKKAEVKKAWESREDIKSSGKIKVGKIISGAQGGHRFIYELSDMIEISEGRLFLGQFLERLFP